MTQKFFLLTLSVLFAYKVSSQQPKIVGTTNTGGGSIFSVNQDGTNLEKWMDFSFASTPSAELTYHNGQFYGTTTGGGNFGLGTIFQVDTTGEDFKIIHHFRKRTGYHSNNKLTLQDGKLWSVTRLGGESNDGVIFNYDLSTDAYKIVHHFADSIGIRPEGELLFHNKKFMGTTSEGGTSDKGVIFSIDDDGSNYQVVHHFSTEASHPVGHLTLVEDKIFGVTKHGGGFGVYGIIYSINQTGTDFMVVQKLSYEFGANPISGIFHRNGVLWGLARQGGENKRGTMFKVDITGMNYQKVVDFGNENGDYPESALSWHKGKLWGSSYSGGLNNQGVLFNYDPESFVFARVKNYTLEGSARPKGGFTPLNGVLYGISSRGHYNSNGEDLGHGALFKISGDSTTHEVMYHLQPNENGAYPTSQLIEIGDRIYGTLREGGTHDGGVIFSLLKNGSGFQSHFSFQQDQGVSPINDLVLRDSVLYGITTQGGDHNGGTIFSFDINTNAFSKVFSFEEGTGIKPTTINVIGEKFWGTTSDGSSKGGGAIFHLGLDGANLQTIFDFQGGIRTPSDGRLIKVGDKIWGKIDTEQITSFSFGQGFIFSINPDGTDFVREREFNAGRFPIGAFLRITNHLWGATRYGGTPHPNDYGIIYRLDLTDNRYKIVHQFDNIEGGHPTFGLLENNGLIWGIAGRGGPYNGPAIFTVDTVTLEYQIAIDLETIGAEPNTFNIIDQKDDHELVFELENKTFGDPDFVLSASSDSNYPIYYMSSDTTILNLTDSLAHILQAGDVTVTAFQNGDETYFPSEVAITITIEKATQTLTFDSIPDLSLDDRKYRLLATSSSGLPIQFVSSNATIASVLGDTLYLHNYGSIDIVASQPGNTNYFTSNEEVRSLKIVNGKETDSLALIHLYECTNGAAWIETWDLAKPMNGWHGIEVNENGRVVEIDLRDNNLEGKLPAEIGQLSKLAELTLDNNKLFGLLPKELSFLQHLEILSLRFNDFFGEIPEELSKVSTLKDLDLRSNEMEGTIPPELSLLTNLQYLILDQNNLTGAIPESIGSLLNLERLALDNNDLSGEIPSSIGNLIQLWSLYLGGNQLTGTIPKELGNLENLQFLSLGSNLLTGTIPTELTQLTELRHLSLQKNILEGSIPIGISNLTNLESLNLGGSHLSGVIPMELTNLPNLTFLSLSLNRFDGTIPKELGDINLEVLLLDRNLLEGEIPSEIGNLDSLRTLDLSSNSLQGSIPESFTQLTKMSVLDLSDNQLAGSIPEDLGNLLKMHRLDLSDNELSDTIPSSIGEMSVLKFLYLDHNQLVGEIPDSFQNMNELLAINVSDNQLTSFPYLMDLPISPFFGGISVENNKIGFADIRLNLEALETDIPYTYHPQIIEDTIKVSVTEGDQFLLETLEETPGTHYQWFKDGLEMAESDTARLEINIEVGSAGIYHCEMINDQIPNLTITRAPYVISVEMNEAPEDILLSNNQLLEAETPHTFIGTLSTSDPNENDEHSYSITAGATSDFIISNDSLFSDLIFNFEVKSEYQITIASTDISGSSLEEEFTIAIANRESVEIDFAKTKIGNKTHCSSPNGYIEIIYDSVAVEPQLGFFFEWFFGEEKLDQIGSKIENLEIGEYRVDIIDNDTEETISSTFTVEDETQTPVFYHSFQNQSDKEKPNGSITIDSVKSMGQYFIEVLNESDQTIESWETSTFPTTSSAIYEAGSYVLAVTSKENGCTSKVSLEIEITKQSQSIVFDKLPTVSLEIKYLKLDAVSSSGLEVDYFSSDTLIAQINADTLFVLTPGNVNILVYQLGNDFYHPADSVEQQVEILPSPLGVNSAIVSIYPNPSEDVLMIAGLHGIFRTRIYDVSGKMVFDEVLEEKEVKISHLKIGIYHILITQNGAKLMSKKLIKRN